MSQTIAENLSKRSDQDLIDMLKYIRDENAGQVSLIEWKHDLLELERDG